MANEDQVDGKTDLLKRYGLLPTDDPSSASRPNLEIWVLLLMHFLVNCLFFTVEAANGGIQTSDGHIFL